MHSSVPSPRRQSERKTIWQCTGLDRIIWTWATRGYIWLWSVKICFLNNDTFDDNVRRFRSIILEYRWGGHVGSLDGALPIIDTLRNNIYLNAIAIMVKE